MNRYDRDRQRKLPRLHGYDYAQPGAYFVTICTYNRAHIFGSIDNGDMVLSDIGHIASACWQAIPHHFSSVELDVSIVMPNHVHGIIVLHAKGVRLGTIVGNYKAAVTRQIHRAPTPYMASGRDLRGMGNIWQARYHDHIIRNERSLQHIRAYIVNNPARWHEDMFFTV